MLLPEPLYATTGFAKFFAQQSKEERGVCVCWGVCGGGKGWGGVRVRRSVGVRGVCEREVVR